MAYYSQRAINEAKQMDLLTYLQRYEPNELVRIGSKTYTTRTHDSLKISNGMWMWWSRGIGGRSALDYLMRVKGFTFIEAVSQIANDENKMQRPFEKPVKKEKILVMPKRAEDNEIITEYLKRRGINDNVISFFIEQGLIYQSVPMNNIVFIGCDENNKPRYAGMRGTDNCRYLGDAAGSDKAFPFRWVNKDETKIHIFEGAIDLLSYATLLDEQGSDFKSQSLVSLSGIYNPSKTMKDSKLPIGLMNTLEANPKIKTIYLHLDNDIAGRRAAEVISEKLKDKYEVKKHFVPIGKDVNDYLCYTKHLPFINSKERNVAR